MLRVAFGAPALRLVVDGAKVRGIEVGGVFAPTEDDGAVRIYYSPNYVTRYVSAIDVLKRRVDPAQLHRTLVLVGVTGLGLIEDKNTPLGVAMPGVAIHAQLLENLYDGTLLRRPAWAPSFETALFFVLGALVVVATPRWKPRNAAALALACVLLLLAGGAVAFRSQRLLFDAANPALHLLLLYGVLLVLTLAEATRQKKALERVVQRQREEAARVAGELDAAKRIQTGTLPRADLLRGDARVDLAAAMIPAREVGGDMYDFFRLDERRLFFLIGDVAGKGLSASIFMAVSKALCKSTMLRAPGADLGQLMSAANAEVSRDNAQMLFVTAFAGVLDLDTGDLDYCNAGHENPWLLVPAGAAVRRIEDGGGPPLCAVDDFAYRGAHCRMRPGEALCLVTDGVTEAPSAAGELYGGARVERALLALPDGAASSRAIVDALCADVETFAAGTEPADDLTVLALRWQGPRAAG
jgi:serine phosphatase RsbU (regulator of sigma subunit)